MNILLLSKSLHRGGGQEHVLVLSKKLKEFGHFVVVGADNLQEKRRFDAVDIPVVHLRFMSHNPLVLVRVLSDIKKIIIEYQIDIVHCHWSITSLYMEMINKFGFSVPYVWTQLQFLKPTFFRRNLFFYGKKAIVLMKSGRTNLVKDFHVPDKDVEEVVLGIDIDKYKFDNLYINQFREELGITNEFVITMLCRFVPEKNHRCTLEALNILVNQDNITNIKCIICGRGSGEYENEIRKIVSNYGLDNYVIYAGYTESVCTLGLTNVMVLPSRIDGYTVSCLEAFAMRVPVVRTKTGAYSDMSDLCIGFELDNHQDLANKIKEVYLGSKEIEKMLDNAYVYTCNNCTADIMVSQIEEVYKKTLRV